MQTQEAPPRGIEAGVVKGVGSSTVDDSIPCASAGNEGLEIPVCVAVRAWRGATRLELRPRGYLQATAV